MGCFNKSDDKEKSEPNFQNRKTTDILFLLIFIAFIIGMFVLSGYAWSEGNYKRVTNGIDYLGCTCGVKSTLTTNGTCEEDDNGIMRGSKAVFVKFTEADDTNLVVMCSPSCPGSGNTTTFQYACYDKHFENFIYYPKGSVLEQKADAEAQCASKKMSSDCSAWFSNSCAITYKSKSILNYCIPEEGADAFIEKAKSTVSGDTWTTAFDSINKGKWIILVSVFFAIVLSFIYTKMLDYCAKPLTYGSMILIFVIMLCGGGFLIKQANAVKDTYNGTGSEAYKDDKNWQMNYYGGIFTFVLAFLYLCLMVVMWKRIALALACVKQAGKVMRDTPFALFLPLTMLLFGVGICAVWLVTAVQLFSIGEVKTVESTAAPSGVLRTISLDEDLRYAFMYHLFGLFWVTQFLIALVEMSIAIITVRWYFAETTNGHKNLPQAPVLSSFWIAVRYHLGSVALGSLIIAIIKFIRACIEYVEHKLKQANQDSGPVKALLCCCRCFFWCLEKCMRFINKNAYIQIALTGNGFFSAAADAMSAIGGNMLRFGALQMVSGAFLFIGRLLVAGGAAFVGFIILTNVDYYSNQENETAVPNPFIPCVFIAGFGYFVGSVMMSIFSTMIDAILMCYIYDEQNLRGRHTDGDMKGELEKATEDVESSKKTPLMGDRM